VAIFAVKKTTINPAGEGAGAPSRLYVAIPLITLTMPQKTDAAASVF
jgi:hypothetical protein